MKKNIFLLFVLINAVSFSQKQKVLLIGIDGLQFEKIATNKTPTLDQFTIKKGYTGGILGSPSEQVTVSGPSWMTILTGVWVDQHKVVSNSSNQLCEAKSIFSYIQE